MKLLKSFVFAFLALVLCCGVVHAATLSAIQLSETQKSFIDSELIARGLNIYGDPEGTVYMGGSPLFDESTGQITDRHEYVMRRHPGILDNYVEVLPVPVDGVDAVLEASRRVSNDFDARRVPARTLAAIPAVRETEEIVAQLVESLAVAVEASDLAAVEKLFARVSQLSNAELKAFTSVFKAARRMLQMPTIQPIEVTEQIAGLLETLDRLEARLR